MRTLAFVFCAFLAAVLLVPASAQSAPPSVPAPNFLIPHDSRDQLPSLAQAGRPPATQHATIKLAAPSRGNTASDKSTCFVIRSYNYAPGNPLSEIPAPTGTTTCVAAADTHVRGASAAVLR